MGGQEGAALWECWWLMIERCEQVGTPMEARTTNSRRRRGRRCTSHGRCSRSRHNKFPARKFSARAKVDEGARGGSGSDRGRDGRQRRLLWRTD
ncbi:hypothetical protein KSP40_PGU015685 [Platanthera guangdongensis]|uniref:Uncharacterized protein n=1 Tax=Platanthera guangdongensis TaxID=2320717 RepID=A0ABR2LX41_9ASPA